MKLIQLTQPDLTPYGVLLDSYYCYYKLQADKGEKITEVSAKVFENLNKHYRKFGGVSRKKSPKEVNGYGLWYYQILKSAVLGQGEPDMDIALGREPKKEGEAAKAEGKPTGGKIKLEELFNKVHEIHKETLEYYKNIRFDKRRADRKYDILSYPELTTLQVDGIEKILTKKEFIIGVEPGGGKTILSTVAAKYLLDHAKKERLLVICPKSIVQQWKSELQNEEMDKHADVIHYQAFSNLYKIPKSDKGRKRRSAITLNPKTKYKYLLERKYKAIIIDECHIVKGFTSDVGFCLKHFLAQTKIEHKIGMTGTPIVTHPEDILGILNNCTTHPVSKLSLAEFKVLVAAENGIENFKSLSDPSVWYTTLADYGISLPDLEIEFVPLSPSPEYIQKCIKILEEAKEMRIVGATGQEMVINTATTKIRVLSGSMKKDWLKTLAKSQTPLVTASTFNQEILFPLAKDLQVPVYSGELSDIQREKVKQDFIAGKFPTLLLNIQAGAVGLNGLQKMCSTMAILNPIYEIGIFRQLIARLRRLGGQPKVKVVIPYWEEFSLPNGKRIAVEQNMISGLQRKNEQFNTFLRTDQEDNDGGLTDLLALASNANRQELYNAIYN